GKRHCGLGFGRGCRRRKAVNGNAGLRAGCQRFASRTAVPVSPITLTSSLPHWKSRASSSAALRASSLGLGLACASMVATWQTLPGGNLVTASIGFAIGRPSLSSSPLSASSCCRMFGRFAGERTGATQNRAAAANPIVTCKPRTRFILLAFWEGNLDLSDACNLGKVQGGCSKHLTSARNRPRRAASEIPIVLTRVSVIHRYAHHCLE